VLVFPDLNAGNIASKMAQIVADVPAYGQILTGLDRPAGEISRGASTRDIFGTAVIVAAQAVDQSFLYPKLKD
jgi:phosphate acetyltransferase